MALESTTVTSVALGNGFFHLARFSAYYRAAFDEPPGQTLRRSRLRRK
jgi:transcriptional regulator GlxA family with amidase domain